MEVMANMALINLLATTQKIKTDIHSHLIPGIDDGVKDLEEAISMVKALKNMGYERLVITPHVMSQKYNNSSKDIKEGFDALKKKIEKDGINIKLFIAAEYYLDEHLLDLIEKKDILTFSDHYILFELSFASAPLFLEDAIFLMQTKGYKPVLAHPERYHYFHFSFDKYQDIKGKGVLFQLNINSFNGYYSKPVKKMAIKLMKEGMVDFLGSDTHGKRHIDALKASLNSFAFNRYLKRNTILNDAIVL
jgi:protein-tyrosine phosphatase